MSHPNKHIRAALKYAESKGWRVEKSGPRAHPWGRIFCPVPSHTTHIMTIASTPKNPQNHAKRIRRFVDACPGHDQES